MVESEKILPGTGRWQSEGLTEGAQSGALQRPWAPSTMLCMVPLPGPGRIYG